MHGARKKRKEPPAPLFIDPGVVTGALPRGYCDVAGSRVAEKLCSPACGRVFRAHGGGTKLQLLPGSFAPASEGFEETRISGFKAIEYPLDPGKALTVI